MHDTSTEDALIVSPSGASSTCRHCGTIYDNYAVDISDYVPPAGDGCEHCDDFIRYCLEAGYVG